MGSILYSVITVHFISTIILKSDSDSTALGRSSADTVEVRSATFPLFKATNNTLSAYILQMAPSGNERIR